MKRRSKVINYLSNKVLLKEIYLSKITYSEYDDEKYHHYDLIIEDLNDINKELIETAKANRAERINEDTADGLFSTGNYTNKQLSAYIKEHGILASAIKEKDLVFRLMTKDHIPLIKNKKGDMVHTKVNFPPFQHFILKGKKFKCVGKTHWKDSKFDPLRGQMTQQLAESLLKLNDRYGNRSNWRGYSWLADMKGHAIVRLCQVALQFNEGKGDNPFAWYTTVINRSFTFVLNNEKLRLNFKNKLTKNQGLDPTFNEQAEAEIEAYWRDKGEENPMKKMILNKPLGFYKRKKVKISDRLGDAPDEKADRKKIDTYLAEAKKIAEEKTKKTFDKKYKTKTKKKNSKIKAKK